MVKNVENYVKGGEWSKEKKGQSWWLPTTLYHFLFYCCITFL